MPQLQDALDKGCLQLDGKVIKLGGTLIIIKAAVELVWYLPGIIKHFDITESQLLCP